MKKLLFTLVSLFILFAIGCQENIMDPNTSGYLTKSGGITAGHIQQGEIPLEGIVIDPTVPGGEEYDLNGSVHYVHNLLYSPYPRATVVLSLTVKASLQSNYGMWIFTGEAEDTLYINEFGYMLEKLYQVPGLNKTICLSFFVTSENIVLSGRCFEFEKNHLHN